MRVFKILLVAGILSISGVCFSDEIDDLLKKLGDEEWAEREAASKALAEKGDSIIPRLLETYKKTDDFEVRSRIVTILEKLAWPSPEDIERIEKLIADYENLRFKESSKEEPKEDKPNEEKEQELTNKETTIIEELQKIKNAADYLVKKLESKTEIEKHSKAVAEVLSGLVGGGVSDFGGAVVKLPKAQPGPNVKVHVKIVQVGPDGKKKEFEMKDGKIVKGGGINHNATPLTALLDTIENAENNTRLKIRAIVALGLRGEKAAVSTLLKLLTSADESVRDAAADALRKITGNDFGPKTGDTNEQVEKSLKKWEEWWNANKDKEEFYPPKRGDTKERDGEEKKKSDNEKEKEGEF